MTDPRKNRVPLLDRQVPFVRVAADLAVTAALFAVLNMAGALLLAGGSVLPGAFLVAAATVLAVVAMRESMRRDRAGE